LKYYPIAVRLKNKRVVIVGGGAVAERKALNLAGSGADVAVVSPEITGKISALVRTGKIRWIKRAVNRADLSGTDIVIAATSDRRINKDVSDWAGKAGALVNVVDNSALSGFISPAVLKKGKAIVAVYTDGKEPELSRDLKDFLKERWDDFLLFRAGS